MVNARVVSAQATFGHRSVHVTVECTPESLEAARLVASGDVVLLTRAEYYALVRAGNATPSDAEPKPVLALQPAPNERRVTSQATRALKDKMTPEAMHSDRFSLIELE